MDEGAAARLRDAVELAGLAEQMVRSRFRRENPGCTADEVEDCVSQWLLAKQHIDLASEVPHLFRRRS